MSIKDSSNNQVVSAAMVVIGDEILSGRTQDTNASHLATMMTMIGIDLAEVRFVSDDEDAIIEAINQLRARNTYVFTSGGIGPTHDDITAEAVAKAFGLPCDHDERAIKLLGDYFAGRNIEFTEARKRMARIPEGASLIDNPVSVAPGFVIANVHVMAGVPSVFKGMLDNVIPTLRTGRKLYSASVNCAFGEGTIGTQLAEIQKAHPDTSIGSYPKFANGSYKTDIVIRSADENLIDAAMIAVEKMLKDLQEKTS